MPLKTKKTSSSAASDLQRFFFGRYALKSAKSEKAWHEKKKVGEWADMNYLLHSFTATGDNNRLCK